MLKIIISQVRAGRSKNRESGGLVWRTRIRQRIIEVK